MSPDGPFHGYSSLPTTRWSLRHALNTPIYHTRTHILMCNYTGPLTDPHTYTRFLSLKFIQFVFCGTLLSRHLPGRNLFLVFALDVHLRMFTVATHFQTPMPTIQIQLNQCQFAFELLSWLHFPSGLHSSEPCACSLSHLCALCQPTHT